MQPEHSTGQVGRQWGMLPPHRRSAPRELDLERTFEALVSWTAAQIKDAPGLIVPLSGTDSALTFAVCSQAVKRAGMRCALEGVHFGSWYPHRVALEPFGPISVQPLPEMRGVNPEYVRWATLQTLAWRDVNAVEDAHWLVGPEIGLKIFWGPTVSRQKVYRSSQL